MMQPFQIFNNYLKNHKTIAVIAILMLLAVIAYASSKVTATATNQANAAPQAQLPVVAIANYGSHSSLNAAIDGIKAELTKQGFIDNQTIKYTITDVSFESSLIPQMITNIKNQAPKVIVTMTTPVAQFAKHAIQDIPLVYNVITDPVAAGLIKAPLTADGNMTGSSDQQDLRAMLQFVKQLIPSAKTIGLLYSTAESNDLALVNMMEQAAKLEQMQLVAVPVDQARDVPMRMQSFRGKVDAIYVGSSGPIQPTLPVIAAEADAMNIPVFNMDEGAVKENMVLASFGVDYHKVGENAGKLVAQILQDKPVADLNPIYPSRSDHYGAISKSKANTLGLKIPADLNAVEF